MQNDFADKLHLVAACAVGVAVLLTVLWAVSYFILKIPFHPWWA